jgi:hypothetical protein
MRIKKSYLLYTIVVAHLKQTLKTLSDIPRELTKENIQAAIDDYLKVLKEVPLKIESDNILGFLQKLKREKINAGPYPDVSIFESANRIMTDMTILFGVKLLLNGEIPEISFDEYKVELGHGDSQDFDIEAENKDQKLVGEAFNVAETFFQPKKTKMLRKLRKQRNSSDQILLMYNSEAVSETYRPKQKSNEFHLKVKVVF